ncbi:hypothetical protein OQA88_118 [Cercophora sp. LCS_1]
MRIRHPSPPGRGFAVGLAVLLGLHTAVTHGSKETAQLLNVSTITPEVCLSKTINYITHTLPQQCLRTSWTGPPAPAGTPETATAAATATTTQGAASEATTVNETQQRAGEQGAEKKEDADGQDFATGSFMSFEEWKEMMLRKSGQDPAKLNDRRPHEHKGEKEAGMGSGEFEAIGEEGEISIDFDALSEKVSELASSPSGEPTAHSKEVDEQVFYDDGRTQYYRSKDAGKTCKERFSFSSQGAGAQILKTSPGAKNARAILSENKDTYMLLECRTKNKFAIVELSDDILVDTVVLANFEFFSSMIRKFRVSVSDRYPVKMDKWVDLGTFEARNSRDIQPFLVEHPQIYTKYIRIEFLSHYGTEYYCPVSLLRVHGTRMLDTWKEQSHDDDLEQIDGPAQESRGEANQTQTTSEAVPSNTTEDNTSTTVFVAEMGLSPWRPVFHYNFSEETCVLSSPTTGDPTPVLPDDASDKRVHKAAGKQTVQTMVLPEPTPSTVAQAAAASPKSATAQSNPSSNSSTPSSSPQSAADSSTQVTKQSTSGSSHASSDQPSSSRLTTASSTTTRNKTATTTPQPSPTVQESFFKTVTKRLQLLETNTSLSLQYIEEQSRFLQEALQKMEKKQAGRVDAFLSSLNQTVLAELRTVRTQYDQIWQSTVIALETQREQSQREIVALSGRLQVLADEVVFQKRMAILQSVLLLSCLVLVIFSRGGGPGSSSFYSGGSFSSPRLEGRYFHLRQDSSPPPSSAATARHIQLQQQQQHYRSDKNLPMTPTSQISREGTPLIHVEGVDDAFYGESSPSPPPPQLTRRRSRTPSEGAGGDNNIIAEGDEAETPPRKKSDSRLGEDDRYASPQVEFGGVVTVNQESTKPPTTKARSGMSQVGGVRKPLPALPEDPSP